MSNLPDCSPGQGYPEAKITKFLFYEARHRVFKPLVARNIGIDAAYADGRLDVKRDFVPVVGDPDREDRAVGERISLGGAQLAFELQGLEASHVANLLRFAAYVPVIQVPDRVLQYHLEGCGLTGFEILGIGRAHGEEKRDGIHAPRGQGHGFLLERPLAPPPPGMHLAVVPVVGVIALERVVALLDVTFETYRAQRLGADPYRVDVFEVEEPAVGGQRAADALDLVELPVVELHLGGLDLHGADFGIGEHLGLVAHAVEELFARMVELRGEGREDAEQEYGE